jgi:16S rRNA (guanine527-N7)-methyltransferase
VASIPLHIEQIFRLNRLVLDKLKKDQLEAYVSLLMEWNQRINLISRRDAENIWESHILHAVSPFFVLEIPSGVKLLDLGSGGGLPGIPMAIVHGGLKVTLLDSIQKKTHALQQIVERLSLPDVQIAQGRAEELRKSKPFAASFDAVIARAVAPLADLVKWSRPFLCKRAITATRLKVCPAGSKSDLSFPYLLALKGGDLEREIRAAVAHTKGVTITALTLVFPGSESLGLVDKKLVVVEYP